MRRARPVVLVRSLRPSVTVDDELEWFFNHAECDMGLTSNFMAALGSTWDGQTSDELVVPAHRYRKMRSWLKAIPDSDAGVLQAAYELRSWPRPLADDLGRLTGIVVKLACASSWRENRDWQRINESCHARRLLSSCPTWGLNASLVRLRREAEVRFARAHRAYLAVRGCS